MEVIKAFRELCPGHAGRKCKIDVSKLSDYENHARRPSVTHIETFCKYYAKSAEELGLINWQVEPAPDAQPAPPADHDHAPGQHEVTHQEDPSQQELIAAWLRDSLIRLAATVAEALTRCPITLTEAELREIITESLAGDPASSEADFPNDAPATSTNGSSFRPDSSGSGVAGPAKIDLDATSQDAQPEPAPAPPRNATQPT